MSFTARSGAWCLTLYKSFGTPRAIKNLKQSKEQSTHAPLHTITFTHLNMPHNLRLFLRLSRHTDHTPSLLSDSVVSYDESPPIQPPTLQDQLAVAQVQLETLDTDNIQGQEVEHVNV
jgi:hypothetical protein